MNTVMTAARPGLIPKRLTVWFRDDDAAAVREVLSKIDPAVLSEFEIEEDGIDEISGMNAN